MRVDELSPDLFLTLDDTFLGLEESLKTLQPFILPKGTWDLSVATSSPASPLSGSSPIGTRRLSSSEITPSGSPTSCFPGGRLVNPVPRYKRDSHIKAEYRRRGKIQRGFDELKSLVPGISENASNKDSKSAMLFKTAEHCRMLRSECKSQREEQVALRAEIAGLGAHIHQIHVDLPAAGLTVKDAPPKLIPMDHMVDEYIRMRTLRNWKFWMFSLVVRPLFHTFSTSVSTITLEEFYSSVLTWVQDQCSLKVLRTGFLNALLHISTNTSIMTHPDLLPTEALTKILESQTVPEQQLISSNSMNCL